MLLFEYVAVVGVHTVHERTHGIVILIADTTHWKYRLRKCQVVIRVGIEQGVGATDRRIVIGSIGTRAISVSLVRVVHHILYTFDGGHTGRSETIEGKTTEWLELQLTTEHQLVHVDVVVVVLQLIEDVEAGIETRVVDIRIQTAAGVHSVAEGIDIEVTLHLACYDIGGLVERTRSLLVTMGTR